VRALTCSRRWSAGLGEDYVTYLFRIENVKLREEPEVQQLTYSGGEEEPNSRPKGPRKAAQKVGRNDPCPGGSGKKYKKCLRPRDAERPSRLVTEPKEKASELEDASRSLKTSSAWSFSGAPRRP
jgi:hypothetical protein